MYAPGFPSPRNVLFTSVRMAQGTHSQEKQSRTRDRSNRGTYPPPWKPQRLPAAARSPIRFRQAHDLIPAVLGRARRRRRCPALPRSAGAGCTWRRGRIGWPSRSQEKCHGKYLSTSAELLLPASGSHLPARALQRETMANGASSRRFSGWPSDCDECGEHRPRQFQALATDSRLGREGLERPAERVPDGTPDRIRP